MNFDELQADLTSHPIVGFDHYNNVINLPLISHIVDGLYVGGHGPVDLGDTFDTVVSMYEWERYGVDESVDFHEFTMYDSAQRPVDVDALEEASDIVSNALLKGERVLVHCQAGINRSNLVATRALMKAYDYTAEDAIALLRFERGSVVLSNPRFEQYLMSLDGD